MLATSSLRALSLATLTSISPAAIAAPFVDAAAVPDPAPHAATETAAERDARMAWWREARFGMFIHWGLYAIPAGAWGDRTTHAEWIRTTAQIPLAKYDEFVPQFNPTKFDADAWLRLAKGAGMEYVVITSKHHDGFCLFDSKETDFDVMATPFKRDIMKEIADSARRNDLVPCWYHSIMDWHHPDYLPRRDWEKDRSAEGADFDRFEKYLHAQVKEILSNYGPIGVLWFDGEWENTWTHERGKRLYEHCRSLQPSLIVNNRVDKGRNDMAGLTRAGDFVGDFGTPEQEVPPQGIPGVDWESCMTMNDHWGWNAADRDWKSTTELVRTLVDVVSKGGNYLLNVGPKADGTLPAEAIERLEAIGAWMKVNGESIHGTTASRFGLLPWGRSTTKALGDGQAIYLQVFDRPADGAVVIPGLWDMPTKADVLGKRGPAETTAFRQLDGGLRMELPKQEPNPHCTVIKLEFPKVPTVYLSPTISPASRAFIDSLSVSLGDAPAQTTIRYTLDGSAPTASSPVAAGPIILDRSATVTAQLFRDGVAAAPASTAAFTKATPRASVTALSASAKPGLRLATYAGRFAKLPDWSALEPTATGASAGFVLPPNVGPDMLLVYEGLINVDRDGVREFALASDDGSKLWIGDTVVVDNDGLHGTLERSGQIALARGWHPIRVAIFNRTGGFHLELKDAMAGEALKPIDASRLRQQ